MPGSDTISGWFAHATGGRPALSHRRLVAAALAALAVGCAITAVRPRPAPTRSVWVAARDLSGGRPLQRDDLASERLPLAAVPSHALVPADSPVGRMLAAPVRRGEPLTDVRVLAPSLLAAAGVTGDVAVPVRVSDGDAALALVHAGDRVDILAAAEAGGAATDATTVVQDVRVLATPARTQSGDGGDAGLVIVAASHPQAAALAQAAVDNTLSVVVRRPT